MDAKNIESSTTTSPTTTTTSVHPLQDVELSVNNLADENIRIPSPSSLSASSTQSATTAAAKRNWVKFDDEGNNTSHDEAVVVGDVATNTNKNRLSPLPPPPVSERSSSRAGTPSRIEQQQQQQQQQSQSTAVEPDVQHVTSASVSIPDVAPAVLDTESTHVNLNASGNQVQTTPHPLHQQQQQQQKQQHLQQYQKSKATVNSQQSIHNGTTTATVRTPANSSTVEPVPAMRTIELSTGRVREGFANGDVIVTLLPANTKWPWITPAIFRPELVPEELMAQGLTLTVEEYVMAMETLVNDYRFTTYNICYKRILVVWIVFAFSVLLTLLFSGLQGMALFALGVGWLFINATAIFVCMWIKLRLARNLEKCLARVNRQLIKHKILLVLDDRGHISCHKVNLCFLYFDAAPCVNFLNEFLEQVERNGGEAIKAGWEAKLDLDLNDIIIQGSQATRVSRKQAVAEELFLTYLQRWGKDFLRRRLDWTVQEAGVHDTPRHLQSSLCPCQYEEEIFRSKIKMRLKPTTCCGINCIGCWL